jgi:hypothetical protein
MRDEGASVSTGQDVGDVRTMHMTEDVAVEHARRRSCGASVPHAPSRRWPSAPLREPLTEDLPHRFAERRLVVCAVVAHAVHEECRRPCHAALIGALDVARYAKRVAAAPKVVGEPVDVQPEIARVSDEVVEVQRVRSARPGRSAGTRSPRTRRASPARPRVRGRGRHLGRPGPSGPRSGVRRVRVRQGALVSGAVR